MRIYRDPVLHDLNLSFLIYLVMAPTQLLVEKGDGCGWDFGGGFECMRLSGML